MKYAVEVARLGSLNKAAETLFVALPNISRSIKELEADLGITIFNRSSKGMELTPDGEEFISYARGILKQINDVEMMYKNGPHKKQRFSVSVPRAGYISEAFANFSKFLTDDAAEIFYKEANSQRTINNVLNHEYNLGIIRYAESYDRYFKSMLEEKELCYELVAEFTHLLAMSADNPLASKDEIFVSDLADYIEISYADPYVPSAPLSKVAKEEPLDNISRRIFIYERAGQCDLLSQNPQTFMWISPAPSDWLEKYNLIQKRCADNQKVYKDVLIYREGYNLSELDRIFITELCDSRRRYIKF